MMMIWGGALLAAFMVPVVTKPDVGFWFQVIIDGEGTQKLTPLIMAAVGLLSIVLAFIPMSPSPRGLIAGLLAPLSVGGCVFCTPGFNALKFFAWMREARPTWYTAVPTIHHILFDRAATDRPSTFGGRLRFIRSCSAPLPPAIVQRTEETFGAPVLAAYGMTETTHQASSVLPADDEAANLGGRATQFLTSDQLLDAFEVQLGLRTSW